MLLSLDRFVGKVAVVTGASSGIGAAIAKELVKHGVIVAGLARRVERVIAQAEQLKDEPGKLYGYKCDLKDEQEIISTFKEIVNELGNIHILVNSAGLTSCNDLICGDTEKWKTVFDTNVIGLCIATREAVQNMKMKAIKGHIIHINSVLGHEVFDMPGLNVYGASKYAVTNLAKTLIYDLAREKLPIKVTNVSPGFVSTEFAKVGGLREDLLPLPSLHASDVANAVIYALSTAPHVNILTSLRFFAGGSYQLDIGRNHAMSISQPSVSRCLHDILDAFNQPAVVNRYCHYPIVLDELRNIRERFFDETNIPGIVGVIDCTHIALTTPVENEHIYVNRKNFHSLNVQMWLWITAFGLVTSQSRSHINPTIIQDSRLEPKSDGTFGFQYRTEDGISHAAQGDPTGYIQGSYSYKDPTGLKVNFNYFAGGRNNNQNSANQPQYSQPHYSNPEPQNRPPQAPQQYYSNPDPYQTQQEYRPRTRPPASYTRPQYQPTYEPRYTETASAKLNEVYDNNDYQYSG